MGLQASNRTVWAPELWCGDTVTSGAQPFSRLGTQVWTTGAACKAAALALRRFKSCPSHVNRIDPKPFYDAVMTSYSLADERLSQHPIDHRPLLVWRAAFDTIKRYFSYQSPGVHRRGAALQLVLQAWCADDIDIDVVAWYMDVAFHPHGRGATMLSKTDMQVLGHTALKIPATLSEHIAWLPGELERHIDSMCAFDHTQFPPSHLRK